jgi:hypothetical protein
MLKAMAAIGVFISTIIEIVSNGGIPKKSSSDERKVSMAKEYNPVGWFEIPTTDLKRARKFYEAVLDVELTSATVEQVEMAWFPSVEDGIGTSGTLIKSEGYTPSHDGILIYFTAPDIEGTLEKVNANGGKTLTPKTSIGEYGFYAYFEDSEGNRLGLHSAA